ncbi:hypothetical protein M9H77_15720 [Catharanthus roseus]|uniref:Uncharacterized protein n=1 Tax=Catharanthus roseus TaxID=4058 RepID=A0ACC0B0K8_CATRO|nr:hypothetical protein M9H77_15720 [Catharanthus roseus]
MAAKKPKGEEESVHFYKVVMFPSDQGLKIPVAFMTKYGRKLKGSVLLKVPNGGSWRIELAHHGERTLLQKGWKEFADFYSIETRFFLVFKYLGNSQLRVLIFDINGVEIEYPSHENSSSEEESEIILSNEDEEISVEILQSYPRNRASKRAKCVEEDDSVQILDDLAEGEPNGLPIKQNQTEELDCSRQKMKKNGKSMGISIGNNATEMVKEKSKSYKKAKAFRSSNPFFIYLVQPSSVSGKVGMYIPRNFEAQYMKKMKGLELNLDVAGSKKTWPVILLMYSPKRALFGVGWKEFVKENALKGHVKNQEGEEGQQGISYRLPIIIRNSSSVLRYFWDGNGLKLVAIDANSFSFWDLSTDFDDGVRKLVRICGSALRNFFLPREVSPNYLEYLKWKFLHRVSSSALQVLATQAMFRAIGIGFSRSLPSAAALNWVLKDGLGRLSRCIYTASLASAFDTNLKRVRFTTSVIFSLSIGVELLTPVFPQYFLLLASIANIAKQISLACYLATGRWSRLFLYGNCDNQTLCTLNEVRMLSHSYQTAVHRSFAVADNLGEVSAKAQIQTVCFDNLGLVLAAMLNILVKNNQRLQAALPFLVYPIFSTFDLFGIYQGLKHVHLQTLTKDRLEIIISMWIQQGHIPSPAEVSREEGIDFLWSEGRKEWPIRIGCLNSRNQPPKLSILTMQALNNEDYYFISVESFNSGVTRVGQVCLKIKVSVWNSFPYCQ